jgi:hypothetical protein
MHHNIKIKLVAKPVMPPEMKVGDTVSFSSSHGKFRVEIEHGSPFDDPTTMKLSDTKRRKLLKEGTFFCKCFVKPKGMPEIGWSKDDPESGGLCAVKPPHP